MSLVAVNGVELYIERRGAGPRLLYLGGSGTTLEATAPLLKALRRSVRPAGVRFAGHGPLGLAAGAVDHG